MNARQKIERLGDLLIPHSYRRNVISEFERASIKPVPYFKIGITGIVITLFALISSVVLMSFGYLAKAALVFKIVVGFVLFPVFTIVWYYVFLLVFSVYLSMRVYYKTRKMEEVFPEFLAELSLNLTAGQNLEEALQNSTEKEFGFLAEEIEQVCKKVKLGVEVELALKEFTGNYDSDVLEETFDLIATSWKKGAATSQLVERIYDNLSIIQYLKNKVVASVSSYRIFLATVTVFIAPIMFALSFHLISLIRAIINKITLESGGASLPITLNIVRVNMAHFQLFSILALMAIAITTAMIISVIRYGSIKEGFKQIVIFAGGTYLVYKVALIVLGYFFTLFNV